MTQRSVAHFVNTVLDSRNWPQLTWLYPPTALYRKCLKNKIFIAVTGSGGKTTTKELIAKILSQRYRVNKSWGTRGAPEEGVLRVWLTRPSHQICVQEVSTSRPGLIKKHARLLQPDIGVVTQVGLDHRKAFKNLDAIAAEKGDLLTSIPKSGWAILNADDPHVLKMSRRTQARIMTFGTARAANVRAENISSTWPERLSFDLIYQGRRWNVQTRLLGRHWVHVVLAAISVGLVQGMPETDILEACRTFEPLLGRMNVVGTPDEITFIQDDWKAPLWSLSHFFDFLKEARAERKIVIFGTFNETQHRTSEQYRKAALQALKMAHKVIFIGPWAQSALKANLLDPDDAKRLHGFDTIQQASKFLEKELQRGDLVLLKGCNLLDHLERLILAHNSLISCWRTACKKYCFCSDCPLLGRTERQSSQTRQFVSLAHNKST